MSAIPFGSIGEWAWSGINNSLSLVPVNTVVLVYGSTMRLLSFIGVISLTYLAAADTVVDVGYAKYQGNHSYPNTVAYLGLPYAEPPVGERRWRSPLPLNTSRVSQEAHGAIVAASTDPEFCIQGTTGSQQFSFPVMSVYDSR